MATTPGSNDRKRSSSSNAVNGVKIKTQGWKSELHDAVWNCDVEKVEQIVQKSTKEELEQTELEMQPLNLAVIKDNLRIAELLLKHGARVDGGETPAIFTACALEKLDMVKLLISYKCDLAAEDKKQKISAIHITADKGFSEILDVLLEAKADPNRRSSEAKMTPLHYAASCGRTAIVQKLITAGADVNAQNITDNTPLLMACNKGHTETVQHLLRAGANMGIHGKPDGLTALHAAVVFGGVEGYIETAKVLIEGGAPINDKSMDGMLTPLHCASAKGHVGCVKLLIDKGSDVHALDKYNSTPLRIAASNANSLENLERFKQVAELLLDAGADINASSAAGNTPLHSIVKLGSVELVKWMLEKHADPWKRNHEGISPFDNAKNEEIRKVLLENSKGRPDNNAPSQTPQPLQPQQTQTGKSTGTTHAPPSGSADKEDSMGEIFTKKTWQPDEEAPNCTLCNAAFTLFNRRHHCRACGKVFCGKCSGNEAPLKGTKKPVRVCDLCYRDLKL